MSNNESLITLATSELEAVNGGGEVTARAAINLPVRGGGEVSTTIRSSNYEACLAAARRTAEARHPDNRNLLQRAIGAPDPNGQARADYEREGVRACGAPPQG